MSVRQVVVQCISISGGIILARTLSAEQFGIFGISTYFLQTTSGIANAGISSALIKQSKKLSAGCLQVAFTLQLILAIVAAGTLWIIAPYLLLIYDFSPDDSVATLWLIRILSLSILLAPLQDISSTQLERKLLFRHVATAEVLAVCIYTVFAVSCALLGYGVWALVIASLARTLTSTAVLYAISPWRIRLKLSPQRSRSLIAAGLSLHSQSYVNLLSSWVVPLYMGSLLGPAAVGYIMWARSLATKPLFLMNGIKRVAFPHLCRIDEESSRARVFSKYLVPLLCVNSFWLLIIISGSPWLPLAVYGDKWLPAIPLLHVATAAAIFVSMDGIAAVAAQARGRGYAVATITALRCLVHVLLVLFFAPSLGVLAEAVGAVVSYSLSSIAMLSLLGFPTAMAATRGTLAIAGSAAALAAVGSAVVTSFGPGVPLAAIASIVICLALWLVGLYAMRDPVVAEAMNLAICRIRGVFALLPQRQIRRQ